MTAPQQDADRLDEIGRLLEEVVDDNTAVVASITRLEQVQRALDADLTREISGLRREISDSLTHRALKDLCRELIPQLTAMEGMLVGADFSDADATEGHVRSLAVGLRGVLERMGAERIAVRAGDDLFDPALHRCAEKLTSDRSPFPHAVARTVVRVLEDGYVLGGRLLSPAVVEIQADPAAPKP